MCFECSPVPASFFPYLSTSLHWCRSPGGRRDTLSESPRCWVGSRCWGDRAAGSGGDRQWLPAAVVLEQKKNRWDGRLAAVLLGRGGVAAIREGAEESPPFASGPEPAAIRQVGGGAGNGGLAAGCPRLEEPSPAARRRKGHRAVHQRGPVPSHGTASEPLSWLRTERQCVREPDRDFFFFFLSPLSLLCHSSSFRLLSLALVCPYPPGTPRPPWRAPPGRGGRGGVERSLVSTPRPARGDGGMWRVGRGREPWERSEAGGVNDNERHLRHSPVSSPTEELRKE